jgi:hypothetical protein
MALPIVLTAAARRDACSTVRGFLRISPIKPPAYLSDSELESLFLGTARSTTFRNICKQVNHLAQAADDASNRDENGVIPISSTDKVRTLGGNHGHPQYPEPGCTFVSDRRDSPPHLRLKRCDRFPLK